MIRLPLLFLCFGALASADILQVWVDGTTPLNDGSFYTTGTTFYAAFLLTAGDAANTTATVSDLVGVDGGLPVTTGDPDFGMFTIGPDPSSTEGVFQTDGTLFLGVTPSSAQSIFAQQFVAQTTFGFTVSLNGDFEGGIPDSFSFQLYNQDLDTLLYEQDFDIRDMNPSTSATPEPSSLVLLALPALLLMRQAKRGRRANKGRENFI